MTSAEPTSAQRPSSPADTALADAISIEHATIYGYGFVSVYSAPELDDLVSDSLAQHRATRETAIALCRSRSVTPPIPAVGYQLPNRVNTPSGAAALAVQMESDTAVAWRAVLEQATSDGDRRFAVGALTECAIRAAQWRKALNTWPLTVPFPGSGR